MNGDAQLIMNKITEIETKQKERHVENKIAMKVVFKKLLKLDDLPCAVHAERMTWFNRYLIGLMAIISSVFIWLVKTHLTSGG